MRSFTCILILACCALLSGCSKRLFWLEVSPENRVLDGFDEDQELRGRIGKLVKGPVVEGSKCNWFAATSSIHDRTIRDAYTDAILKAGPAYDALVNVLEQSTMYAPLLYCVSLKGTPVRMHSPLQQNATVSSEMQQPKPSLR